MKLKITTPDNILLETTVKSINISEKTGSFTILPNHAPFLSSIESSFVVVTDEDGTTTYVNINSGILKVLKNTVVLIIDYGAMGITREEAFAKFEELQDSIMNRDKDSNDMVGKIELELARRVKEMSSY